MSLGLCVFLGIAGISLMVWSIVHRQNKISESRTMYEMSLSRLKRDPNNPNLREKTLRFGRAYANLARNNQGHTIFDEMALMNDINAACARATVGEHNVGKVEVVNTGVLKGNRIAQEIEKLGQLFLQGVLTAEEFERAKSLFLGAPPDKAAAAVDLLRNLNALKQQGVLSESEFNAKKWEVLSERLLPGRLRAAR